MVKNKVINSKNFVKTILNNLSMKINMKNKNIQKLTKILDTT